jgi:chorismate mutase
MAAHQPAREAQIIRRLIERNRGAFPPATLVRMWRELLAATVRQQVAESAQSLLREFTAVATG